MGGGNILAQHKITVANLVTLPYSTYDTGDIILGYAGSSTSNPDNVTPNGSIEPRIVTLLGVKRSVSYLYQKRGEMVIQPFYAGFSLAEKSDGGYLYIGRPDINLILVFPDPYNMSFSKRFRNDNFFTVSDIGKTLDIYIGDKDPAWEGATYYT